jgi:Domain of unknown function (DUF362)
MSHTPTLGRATDSPGAIGQLLEAGADVFRLKAARPYRPMPVKFNGPDKARMEDIMPVDFAVIDGVWGMEGQGPTHGTPVATNVVLAGLNRVAVDRVALTVMEIPNNAVTYLTYATEAGLGPPDTRSVTVLGDAYFPYPFVPAITPQEVFQPVASPATISISAGQSTAITYKIPSTCYTLAQIIQDSDDTPTVIPVRTLHGFKQVSAPGQTVTWNGTDHAGAPVAPGTYLARIQAAPTATSSLINYAVCRITVMS